MFAVVAGNRNLRKSAREKIRRLHQREIVRMGKTVVFHEDRLHRTDHTLQMREPQSLAAGTEPCRPLLHQYPVELRHAGRRRAGTRAVGKHMQAGNAAFFRKCGGIFEHLFRLGRETGDHIRPEGDIRPKRPHVATETNGIGP
ncbi:hypothetical protein D3C80_1365760 [compost metagenome]